MNRQRFTWFFIAIVLAAIALRFFQLGSVPHGVYIDEIAMLVDAKSVSQSGLDMHGRPWYQVLYPSYGDFKLPVYLWLASLSVKLFGVSDWVLRLPSAVAGVLTVIVTGLIARRLVLEPKIKPWIQLSTMAIVAFSPWSVLFSRTGFEGHVAQFLVALSVWLLLKTKQQWWWGVIAALVGGLATYGYFSVRFVWPVVLGVISVSLLIEWSRSRRLGLELGKKVVVPLLVFGLCLIPMIKSPLYADSNRFRLSTDSVLNNDHLAIQSNIFRELAGNTFVDRFMFHRQWLLMRELALNYADNLSLNFLFVTGDPNLRHGTGIHGLFVLPLLPALFLGCWYLYDKNKRVLLILVVWWLIALLPASVPETTPHALRSLNALVPLSLLMGFGLGWWLRRSSNAIRGLTLVVMAAFTCSFLWHYFTAYVGDSASAWQQGHREVVEQIYAQKDYDHLVILPFDERFYLWLMAYGPYSADDFHGWTSQHYMFKDHPDISFVPFEGWKSVPESAQQVMVVGKVEDVEKIIQRTDVMTRRTTTISNVNQLPLFMVAVIEKKQ